MKRKTVEKKVKIERDDVTIIAPAPPPAPKMTAKRTVYMIANNHTGDIIIPRRQKDFGINAQPLILLSGQSIEVDATEWRWHKEHNRSLLNYMDQGLISEVAKEGPVPVMSQTTTELPIPPHLQREEESGKSTDVKASVRRKTISTVTM